MAGTEASFIPALFMRNMQLHKIIIDKRNENPKKALSFVNQVIQNNYPPNIDALIDNFDKALSHPDKKDLDNLCKRVVKALSNVIK